jgi:hypothetical protein
MLRDMRREQQAWAMMIRCRKVFGAAQARYGSEAEAWARDCSARVLQALVDEVVGSATPSIAAYGVVTLVAKSAGLELCAYSLPVGAGPYAGVRDRDRERFTAALGASLIAGANGVLTLGSLDGQRVQVWELADQRLTPSEHGQLLLEPDNYRTTQPSAEYMPGTPLPQPT